jgi:hypothetical protein
MLSDSLQQALDSVAFQVDRDEAAWGPYNSAHEAKGILDEEVWEFTKEVYVKQELRDLNKMRKELLQIAAVAIRAAAHVCNEERGRR